MSQPQKDNVYLYGCGELGLIAKDFFIRFSVPFIPVDSDPSYQNKRPEWSGHHVVPIEDVPKDAEIVICISTYPTSLLQSKLSNLGYKNVTPLFKKIHSVKGNSPDIIKSDWIASGKEEIGRVIERLFDKKSVDHFLQFYKWHTSFTEDDGYTVDTKNRYFIDEIKEVITENETFVDVGAYDGRVSKKFAELVKNKYNNIYCIEGDPITAERLKKDLVEIDRLFVINTIVGETDGTVGFITNMGYLSSIDNRSNNIYKMEKLDSLDCINKPTFIKYHLEGGELSAIKGSIQTLKTNRPIVVVTSYHTIDGLLDLPSYLMENLAEYRFIWRNHNYQGQGSVIYCIPNERYK